MHLIVTVKKLNQRSKVPDIMPDPSTIVGVVQEGFLFEGEQVNPELVPAFHTHKWYRDRDNHFYWGGGLRVLDTPPPTAAPAAILPWWMTDLGIEKIWQKTQGENVKIAILDSGYSSAALDVKEAVLDAGVFIETINPDPIPIEDVDGHGTHCASLIAARNKRNITACAPKAGLLIAKITSAGGVSSFNNIIKSIEWAIENKADVISISYGGASTIPSVEEAIQKAIHQHNIVVVAAIGNIIEDSANDPHFPAMYADCIAVGSLNADKRISSFTIVNAKTEINAPGDSIPGYWKHANIKSEGGTSQATAIVAGIIALIIARHKALSKPFTVKSITELIEQTAEPIPGSAPQKRIVPEKIFAQL